MRRGPARGRCLPLRLLATAVLAACGDGPADPVAEPAPPAPAVTELRLEPLVTAAGEPFTLTARIEHLDAATAELDPDVAVPLERAGVAQRTLVLHDDGTHGDTGAGDGIFTLDGLVLPMDGRPLAAATISALAVRDRSAAELPAYRPAKLTFRSIEPRLLDDVDTRRLAPDVQAAPHVVAIRHARARDLSEEAVGEILERYYALMPDDRDFLILMRPPSAGTTWAGRAVRVRNEVRGVGLGLGEYRAVGSPRRLQMVLHAARGLYSPNVDPAGSFCLVTHELTHRWAAYVGLGLSDGGHWTDALDRDRSGFGAAGVCELNDLELYLAGLLPQDSVRPSLSADGVTLADLLREHGPRLPPAGRASTDFTIGLAVVHDRELTPTELGYFDVVMRAYTAPRTALGGGWIQATGGRSRLDAGLVFP